MHKKYPHLFSPIRLGNVQLRNRIVSPPNSLQELSPEGHLRPQDVAFYELKAQGGAALVTLGESIIHTPTGKSHTKQIPLDDDLAIPSLAETAWAIRRHGAVASIELSHGGKFANINNSCMRSTGLPAYGPMQETLEDGTVIHQLDEDMILMLIDAYGQAARRAKIAGFNMVHIHGGHGWLPNQFMSASTNQRDDRWGGSFENRMRFTDMLIARIREEVGPHFPIEFRMSGKEYTPGGYEIEEAIRIARHLDGKVQLINVSAGNHEYMEAMLVMHPCMFKEDGYFADLAAQIKKEVRTPIAAVGGLLEPEMMEAMLAEGRADIIEVGRGLLAEPFMAEKYKQGREDEAVRCLRCFACVGDANDGNRVIRCALNPVIGRELESRYSLQPAVKKKKVLIAGAGPAGLQAAVTAAKRGHQVILCEQAEAVGGALRSEAHVLFKKRIFQFPHILETQARRLGVEIRLNTKVDRALMDEVRPDAFICAIGGEKIVPNIPGIAGKNVIHATNIPADVSSLGQKIVVLGGGLVGAEMAVDLAWKGKDVTIVEMLDDVARDANSFHRAAIGFQIRDHKIQVHTGITGTKIDEKGLYGLDKNGQEVFFPADTVVYAVGMKPLWDQVDALREIAPDEFYQIGDCFQVGKIKDATTTGFQAALDL